MPGAVASEPRNHLAGQPSAYLSSAAHQPVHWYPWGPEPFALAQKSDKPILLDIGAVWCHWCHVMDREDYENAEIAGLINELFVAIKVDRDERPDIDKRYQQAVQAVGGGGGWPLTAFLTPTGEVFFGGTYFAPEDGPYGPGLKTLLPRLADFYQGKKKEIYEKTGAIAKKLADLGRGVPSSPGKFSTATLDAMEKAMLDVLDSENGGFSRSPGPKFPAGAAVDFLFARYTQMGNKRALEAATLTLDRMADGGVHDRVGRGFHRYSTDMFWRVPHFEKMAYDQAALLENYLHAYQVTGKSAYADVANGIVDYVLWTLSSPAGGFFAFQDADVSLQDDGSYFTWTKAELRRVLSPEEFRAVEGRFGIVDDPRQFRELPARQVLAVRKSVDEVARVTGQTPGRVEKLLQNAIAKLRAERAKRRPPFVDQTIFASDNGMLISSFLDAWRILGREDAKKRALDSYDFVLAYLGRPDGTFFHAYGKGKARVAAWLADQVWMARAALDLYQVRGDARDLARSRTLLDSLWKTHRDASTGGLFDLPPGLHTDNAYLSAPAKPIEDNPEPSANAVAIQALEEIASITGEGVWSRRAAETLDAFSGEAPTLGPSGGAYALAGFVAVHPGAHVVIVGDRSDPRCLALLRAAFQSYRPGSTAAIYARGSTREVPPAVAAQIEAAGQASSPLAFICVGTQCALPTPEPARVAELVRDFGRAPAPKASAAKKAVP